MKLNEVLKTYREKSCSEKDKGTRFELLMKNFLLTYAEYRGLFDHVWMWNEFPCRKDFGGKDTGIDLVARTTGGDYWAVQCKCYQETSLIDKPAVDSFLATSSKQFLDEQGNTIRFAQRLWISTTNKWNKEAENTIRSQNPPVARIGLSDLEAADVDWDALEKGIHGQEARRVERKPRPHQQKAIEDTHEYFQTHERGKLIMACGTGKTYTALKIAEQEAGAKGFVLFLVPSIALLGQTLSEWSRFSEQPMDSICICSDVAASKSTGDEIKHVDLALPATTDTKKIIQRVRQARQRALHSDEETGMTVVFSTYQSIEAISRAQKMLLAEADGEEQAAESYLFDLIICDEAHRTTGVTLAGTEESAFVKVHDTDFLQARRRLYMTATPRLYTADSKKKAAEKDAILCSMDDEELYGQEIYRIGFGEAVEKHLLSDYKVIVLTIGDDQIPPALQKAISDKNQEIQTDDASKLIGCINALSKRMIEQSRLLAEVDPQFMHTAVAFCSNIKTSQRITGIFNDYKDAYYESLSEENREKTVLIESAHVDGSMGAATRSEKLAWLKNTPKNGKDCRILTNVRCLSEGVDVPSLDAVLFLSARNSQVDVVQSVGRVMRTAPGKKYGYIIIPVIVPVHQSAEEVLDENKSFGVVWSVLNALRAHDDRFNATVNKIELNRNKAANGHILIGGSPDDHYDGEGNPVLPNGGKQETTDGSGSPVQTTLYFDELQGAIYARMVEKVGSKRYWEQWAQDIAKIAARHKERIRTLITGDEKHKKAFQKFMRGLHTNINPYIRDEEAIEMLAQHLITKPVFEALFENYSFVSNNTVSQAMQRILNLLDEDGMQKDQEQLDRFYQSVKERCEGVDNAEGKQKIIVELYDKFFKTALPKTVGKLGIVYTPVEVVDFILHSVNDVLKKEFHRSLSDEQVHILDPFTGTGTFLTRLLQSGIIKQKDLIRKYTRELHANEIVLLAYYIASINIENAFHDLMQGDDYTPFDGICLTDTFQLGEGDEEDALFSDVFPKNSVRVLDQKHTPIRVIVGNPPYSVGQSSANDNAQNESYPKLEKRIAETYVAGTNATNKNALYDSYIKAFRWASDRIDPDKGGVIGFVTNSGWVEKDVFCGLRKCFEEEFSSVYVFDLQGAVRGKMGESARRAGGNVFNIMTGVAITVLVKNPAIKKEKAEIYYVDIGDYLTREEKLKNITDFKSCMSSKFPVTVLRPNEYNDWLNQRNGMFEDFIPMEPDKKFNLLAQSVFVVNSRGLETGRDAWIYNFSLPLLKQNVTQMIDFYNRERKRYVEHTEKNVKDFINMNPTKISWTSTLLSYAERDKAVIYDDHALTNGLYRPFQKSNAYIGESLIHRRGQMDKFFPDMDNENLLICVSGIGSRREHSVFITNTIADLHIFEAGTQCFPLYYYDKIDITQGTLFDQQKEQYVRRDGITDFIFKQACGLYGPKVTKEDIFYYVYGFLHLPAYRTIFAADLKKSLPRILLVEEPRKFWQISKAGRALADIHLHYESQPFPKDVVVEGESSGNFRVQKLRFAKVEGKDDKSTIIYNEDIRVSNIPTNAYDYVVNGRSPMEWVMDRYQIKVDKDSGIENDPNKWGEEHGNPRYILDLLLRVITVSLRTLEIVEGLPDVKFE